MPSLRQGDSSNCTTPVLDVYFRKGGVLIDMSSIEYIIYDKITDPPNLTQVYPASGRATVDLSDCPVGHRLSVGNYVAEWDVPISQVVGDYEIHWFYKEVVTDPERLFAQEFVVIEFDAAPPAEWGYCSVQDLRDEGITVDMMSDARAVEKIREQSLFIDRVTGRWFEARERTFKVRSKGHTIVFLGHPIIKVDSMAIVSGRGSNMTRDSIDVNDVLIYNRHLTEGLYDPDDRDNPRIEYQGAIGLEYPGHYFDIFPKANQIVEVEGVFGYTELGPTETPGETSDGSQVPLSYGDTPDLIKHVCKLLVAREIGTLGDPSSREDWRERWRLEQEKTVDQMYKKTPLSSLKFLGSITGDPEIDSILNLYKVSPGVSTV